MLMKHPHATHKREWQAWINVNNIMLLVVIEPSRKAVT